MLGSRGEVPGAMSLRRAILQGMTDAPLVIGVGPASDPRPGLQLRVAPDYLMEVADELRRQGVLLGFPIRESATVVELTTVMASTAGGLAGVAAVIRAITSRHAHRHVQVTNRDGETLDLTGLSRKEMDERLTPFLAREQKKHDEIRHLYEFPNLHDRPPGQEE
jgi:hypothetical protein